MNHIPTFVRKGCSLLIIGMLLLGQGGGVAYAEEIVDVVAESILLPTPDAEIIDLDLAVPTTEKAEESTGTDTEMLFTTQSTSTEDENVGDGFAVPDQEIAGEIVASSSTTTATTTEMMQGTASSSNQISEVIFSSECVTSSVMNESSQATTSTSTHVMGDLNAVEASTSTPCVLVPTVGSTTEVVTGGSTSASSTPTMVVVVSSTDSRSASTTLPTQSANTTGGGPVIVSGKAVAMANILNIVNTNLVNSEGSIIFSNLIDQVTGEVDLRGDTASGTSRCSLSLCTGQSDISANMESDAYIANLIDVEASSGDNLIENAEDARITTGNAYAALNLVNIANMNFVDSRYLLVSLNAFEGINGDIIFPNLDHIFATQGGALSGLNLTNTAGITTDLTIDADSGGNSANSGSTTISAGDAHGSSNVFNQINTTLGANDSVAILFRIHGTWTGGLVNAPRGLVSTMNDDGTFLLSTAPHSDELLRLSDNPMDGTGRDVDVTGTSTALIENVVHIAALSGDNAIMNAESALITSGNAYAGANIINVANANVLGRNWILAIVNIFGDFNGDIAFGRPDLWVGERVVTPPPFHNGNSLMYRFTVINNGDAQSSNVTLRDTVDTAHLEILDSSLPYKVDAGGLLVWELGDMPPGGAVELTLNVRIKDVPPGTAIVNEISVRGHEAESILKNNNDRTTITTYVAPSSGGGSAYNQNEQMVIVITPRNSGSALATTPMSVGHQSASTTSATSTSTLPIFPLEIMRSTATSSVENMDVKSPQAIIIRNPNNTKVDAVVFRDILRDPNGAILSTETWDLDTLLPHEEIAIGYDIAFGKNATTGTYVLSSTISRAGAVDAFEGNGRIYLNKNNVNLAKEINIKNIAVAPSVMSASPSNSQVNAEAVGALVDTVLLAPETAYAANVIASGDDTLARSKIRGPYLIYFLLPMFATILYLAIRRTTKLGQ